MSGGDVRIPSLPFPVPLNIPLHLRFLFCPPSSSALTSPFLSTSQTIPLPLSPLPLQFSTTTLLTLVTPLPLPQHLHSSSPSLMIAMEVGGKVVAKETCCLGMQLPEKVVAKRAVAKEDNCQRRQLQRSLVIKRVLAKKGSCTGGNNHRCN